MADKGKGERKKTYLVTLKLKENHCICDVFDKIERAFNETSMGYTYYEIRRNNHHGGILMTLSSLGYSKLVNTLQDNDSIESFRIFAFEDLLNNDEVKAKYSSSQQNS